MYSYFIKQECVLAPRIGHGAIATAPIDIPDMSIQKTRTKVQFNSLRDIKVYPDCDNPLDYRRIFSRARYRNDFNGKTWQADKNRVTGQAKILYHEDKIVRRRVERNRCHLKIHKNMIAVKVEQAFQEMRQGGGKRGKVAGFSKASRRRMMNIMNQQRDGVPKTFVSLTYADEALFNKDGRRISHPADWKRHLEMLRKRIERNFPDLKGLWRIELKNRKSGEFVGKIAPHYHILIWNIDPDFVVDNGTTFEQWLQQAWFEILDTELQKHFEHGTHVSQVKSTRHAIFYVSKYVAKMDDEFFDRYLIGRRWGRIGQFDCTTSIELTMSFDEMVHFRRLLASWLKSKGSDYAKTIKRTRNDVGFSAYGLDDLFAERRGYERLPVALLMYFHVQELLE